MAVKAVLILSTCLALVLGAAIEPRTKRQTNQAQNPLSSISSAYGGGSQGGIPGLSEMQNGLSSVPGGNIASSAAGAFADGIAGMGKRLQSAFNATYQDERNSVSDSFNSVKDGLQQGIQTGANLTKTAFDLGTIFPKFGKNLIIGN